MHIKNAPSLGRFRAQCFIDLYRIWPWYSNRILLSAKTKCKNFWRFLLLQSKKDLNEFFVKFTLPLTNKFWSCHSFVRLLPNRDLPDLTCEFFNKEGLYLALSAAKPMLFERYKYLVSSHWAFNHEIPDKRRYLQKMNWFLPYKCLFCQPYFFSCISWIFLQRE